MLSLSLIYRFRDSVYFIVLSVLLTFFLGCSANFKDQIPEPKEQMIDNGFQVTKTNSYVVFGKRYYPLESAANFHQKGIASWYGQKFHGRKPSNGEIYDRYEMTAAHKRLPLPTYVEVRSLENNRTIVVRVNDRGPFHGDRIIDLSFAAAQKLGMIENGTAYVEIKTLPESGEYVTAERIKRALAQDTTEMHLQIGAFSNVQNANGLLRRISKITGTQGRIITSIQNSSRLYRVQVGPLLNVLEIEDLAGRLRGLGINEYHLVRD